MGCCVPLFSVFCFPVSGFSAESLQVVVYPCYRQPGVLLDPQADARSAPRPQGPDPVASIELFGNQKEIEPVGAARSRDRHLEQPRLLPRHYPEPFRLALSTQEVHVHASLVVAVYRNRDGGRLAGIPGNGARQQEGRRQSERRPHVRSLFQIGCACLHGPVQPKRGSTYLPHFRQAARGSTAARPGLEWPGHDE